jgi:DNA-binding response OmpR family regulator
VRISVGDHGPGIPAAFRSHIFQKFAQADATNARQKGGTGLGLSIVKQIATRLGGEVRFADAPGGGTVFHVELPSWNHIASREIDLDVDPDAPRLLFCDNDLDTAICVREQLGQSGWATDFACTVSDALTRTAATNYAAVVVGLDVPDEDGRNLILQLRERAGSLNALIIGMSSVPDLWRDDPMSSGLGVLAWFAKPLDIERLMQLLNKPGLRDAIGRPLILHVDDDPDILRLVARALGSTADLVSVESIDAARRAIKEKHFDLVVLDIALDSNSGLDLLPDLRNADDKPIPVVIFSARVAGFVCDAQVQAVLSKSRTSIESLMATVHDHLSTRPAPAFEDVL